MYWQVTELTHAAPTEPLPDGPRFVLHRHRDDTGAHHDLRMEHNTCLLGFRIGGDRFETGCWATEKMPHPKHWLEDDGALRRVVAGRYGWRETDPTRRTVTLYTTDATITLCFERCKAPDVAAVRTLTEYAQTHGLPMERLGELVADGATARRNAIARLCGLSRELDGDAFDEGGWRTMLEGMTLREINDRLAAVETRYDRVHPPLPTSRPEPLDPDADAQDERALRVMHILGE